MVQRPTYDDASLILRLCGLRREERMRQARAWFTAKCKVKSYEELIQLAPGGSEENASVRMVTSCWDLVASFMTSGVLNKELFFQSGRELLLVWERVRDCRRCARPTRIRTTSNTSKRLAMNSPIISSSRIAPPTTPF